MELLQTKPLVKNVLIYFKELEIANVRAAKGRDFRESIKLVSQGILDLDPLITHTLPYTDLNKAIQMLIEPNDNRLKVILERR